MKTTQEKGCTVWAIGGGKGGVGKSFLISNMAHSLALQGKKTILIDADFGGANLHSFLGISRPDRSLSDFFIQKTPLADLVIDSPIPNLGLVVGMIRSFTPENINHGQKQKFLRHISGLGAENVLVDLGAGASFNIIDTFLQADKKIVVTLPEVTAMDNMYSFLNYAFFRRLVRGFADRRCQYVILNAYQEFKEHPKNKSGNLQHFVQYLRNIDGAADRIVQEVLDGFEVNIIINQARTKEDTLLGNSVKSVCLKHLGFRSRYSGYVEHDESVPRAINSRQPYLLGKPAAGFRETINRITHNVLNNEQVRTS